MPHLSFFATTACNRGCVACTQRIVQDYRPGYFMGLDEIGQCLSLIGRRFEVINFTGGEPLLWPHLEEACEMIRRAKACRVLRVFSNGRAREAITPRLMKLLTHIRISRYGDRDEQLAELKAEYGDKINVVDTLTHVVSPTTPMADSIPGQCNCRKTAVFDRHVYPCPNLLQISLRLGKTWHEDPELVKPIDGDHWPGFEFAEGRHPVCEGCAANGRIRGRLETVSTSIERGGVH